MDLYTYSVQLMNTDTKIGSPEVIPVRYPATKTDFTVAEKSRWDG